MVLERGGERSGKRFGKGSGAEDGGDNGAGLANFVIEPSQAVLMGIWDEVGGHRSFGLVSGAKVKRRESGEEDREDGILTV